MLHALDQALLVLRRVARLFVWISLALLLAAVALILAEVFSRRLFGISLGGTDELSSYAFAIAVSGSLPYALLERANIRIDAVYQHLSKAAQAWLDVISLLGFGLFMGLLVFYASGVLLESISNRATANTPLSTPLWIPQSLWGAGLLLFVIVYVAVLLRTLAALLKGDLKTVQRLVGSPSTPVVD